MNRRTFLSASGSTIGLAMAAPATAQTTTPDWSSLAAAFRVPDWFRDAKFGIWGHWGPQCVPEFGDWYGRKMYEQGDPFYDHHRKTYGHPADTGFIDILGQWRGERWDPAALVTQWKAAGARYVMGMAGHHDNVDLFDSSHHPWNSVRVGPKRDIAAGWRDAVRGAGLRFGLSNHISHAWHWWQTAYGYDATGPRAGERYDAARLTKRDGRGKYWDGLDPQALYTGPSFAPPDGIRTQAAMDDWVESTSRRWMEFAPSDKLPFVTGWLARQKEMVEKYRPDIVYFDNSGLPFGPAGVEAAAHFYGQSIADKGAMDVVLTGKLLTPFQRTAMVEDVERGFSDRLRPEPWQTCTCLGDWHYNRSRFTDKSYVPAHQVLQRLADVVSKNGNLLLSVPMRGDGSIDSEEERILADLGRWMTREGEAAIYGSRPWRIYGEGPTDLAGGMHNEGQASRLGANDVRFTVKNGTLNAILLDWPTAPVRVASLGRGRLNGGSVERVRLVGGGRVRFVAGDDALMLTLPPRPAGGQLPVVRIEGRGLV